jgi:hypothetical protein
LRALSVARRFGDTDLEFGALALLGASYVYSGRVAEGMALIDEAMAAVSSGEVSALSAAGDIYCRLLSACERTADVRRAEQWMSVIERFVQRSGDLLVSTTCRMHYGAILTEIGRWVEAEEHLLAALRLSEYSYRAMRMYPSSAWRSCARARGGSGRLGACSKAPSRTRWRAARWRRSPSQRATSASRRIWSGFAWEARARPIPRARPRSICSWKSSLPAATRRWPSRPWKSSPASPPPRAMTAPTRTPRSRRAGCAPPLSKLALRTRAEAAVYAVREPPRRHVAR